MQGCYYADHLHALWERVAAHRYLLLLSLLRNKTARRKIQNVKHCKAMLLCSFVIFRGHCWIFLWLSGQFRPWGDQGFGCCVRVICFQGGMVPLDKWWSTFDTRRLHNTSSFARNTECEIAYAFVFANHDSALPSQWRSCWLEQETCCLSLDATRQVASCIGWQLITVDSKCSSGMLCARRRHLIVWRIRNAHVDPASYHFSENGSMNFVWRS